MICERSAGLVLPIGDKLLRKDMKKRKICALLLSMTLGILTFMPSCSTESVEENKPDYTKSAAEYDIWAYSSTCDDWYQYKNEKGETVRIYFEDGTRQTAENTALYADGGYNLLFVDWSFPNDYATDFESSSMKRVMDDAYEAGLKCMIFEGKLHGLSSSHTSLIDPENADGKTKFASQEDLENYVAERLRYVKDHPAFYGVSLIDEPYYTQFPAMGEVYRAIQAVVPGAFCNLNLNPMSHDYRAMMRYCEEYKDADKTLEVTPAQVEEAYGKYLDDYYTYVGQYSKYIQYDSYPLLKDREWEGWETMLAEHVRNAQFVADFAAEKGMTFGHVYQTYQNSTRRAPTKTDMMWQVNLGMAMGVKNHSYYTYYPTPNTSDTTLPDDTATIVDREGKPNETYYLLQELNAEMQFNAKALMHFEYELSTYYTYGEVPGETTFLSRIEKSELQDITDVTLNADGAILISQQYDDEQDWRGYYVMNVTDPQYLTDIKVTLTLEGYEHVQIYNGKEIETKALKNGTVSVYLPTGQGVFVIPY